MAAIKTPEDKLAEEYEGKFEAARRTRIAFERQWYMNLAMLSGKQWVQWVSLNSDSISLAEPPAPRHRVRSVTNKIKPRFRREQAKLTKEQPHFYVAPASTEDKDIAAARAGEHIAEYLLFSRDYNRIRGEATFWLGTTGIGFIKTYWDEHKTDLDGVKGKICWSAPAPFRLFVPNLQEQDIEQQSWVCEARAFEPQYVIDTFGKEIEPDVSPSGDMLETRFQSVLGIRNDRGSENKLIYVKEVWIKPCKKFPDGAQFFYANGKILEMYEGNKEPGTGNLAVTGEIISDFPYEHGFYPYAVMRHIPSGSFYPSTMIQDLIPLQKEYNRVRSQLIEGRNRTSKPQYTVPKGSVDPNKITSEPGLVIEYMPGMDPPKALEQPEFASYVHNEPAIIVSDMDDISNQFETTQGGTPPGVEAASAIAYLQEENDTILHPTIESIESCTQMVGVQALALVHQFWSVERTVKVTSANQAYEVIKFKGSDIGGMMDFRVEHGSMAPRSRAAKQAFIIDAIKSGLITPEMGFQYLEMNETSRLYQEMQLDTRQQQRENLKMEDGLVVQVNAWDNHEAHIIETSRYMKTQQFELLDVLKQAAFLDHLNQHRIQLGLEAYVDARIQSELAAQQQQQQLAAGATQLSTNGDEATDSEFGTESEPISDGSGGIGPGGSGQVY